MTLFEVGDTFWVSISEPLLLPFRERYGFNFGTATFCKSCVVSIESYASGKKVMVGETTWLFWILYGVIFGVDYEGTCGKMVW